MFMCGYDGGRCRFEQNGGVSGADGSRWAGRLAWVVFAGRKCLEKKWNRTC